MRIIIYIYVCDVYIYIYVYYTYVYIYIYVFYIYIYIYNIAISAKLGGVENSLKWASREIFDPFEFRDAIRDSHGRSGDPSLVWRVTWVTFRKSCGKRTSKPPQNLHFTPLQHGLMSHWESKNECKTERSKLRQSLMTRQICQPLMDDQ